MTDEIWEVIEKAAAVITILQATPRVISFAKRLFTEIKRRFSKPKRKIK